MIGRSQKPNIKNKTMKAKYNKKSAFTLIELTVVILVLLSLITVLFIGASAWKRGSDRAASILNIRNAQTAGRSYQNMYNGKTGDLLTMVDDEPTEIVGTGNFMESTPTPPSDGEVYTWATAIPAIGNAPDDYAALFMSTNFDGTAPDVDSDVNPDHRPEDVSGW